MIHSLSFLNATDQLTSAYDRSHLNTIGGSLKGKHFSEASTSINDTTIQTNSQYSMNFPGHNCPPQHPMNYFQVHHLEPSANYQDPPTQAISYRDLPESYSYSKLLWRDPVRQQDSFMDTPRKTFISGVKKGQTSRVRPFDLKKREIKVKAIREYFYEEHQQSTLSSIKGYVRSPKKRVTLHEPEKSSLKGIQGEEEMVEIKEIKGNESSSPIPSISEGVEAKIVSKKSDMSSPVPSISDDDANLPSFSSNSGGLSNFSTLSDLSFDDCLARNVYDSVCSTSCSSFQVVIIREKIAKNN